MTLGTKMTEEAKRKISRARLGKPLTPQHRANMSAAHIGKTSSVVARAKISATMKAIHQIRKIEQELWGV